MKWTTCLSSCVLWMLLAFPCSAQEQPGETEAALLSIKSRLPFISTGDFLYRREPDDLTGKHTVTDAWKTLTELQSAKLVTTELVALTGHTDADVRALALLALVAKETPEVVPLCLKLALDESPVLPREFRPAGLTPADIFRQPLFAEPQTVGDIAQRVLKTVGWHSEYPKSSPGATAFDADIIRRAKAEWALRAETWWAQRKDNPDWLAWHEFRYKRATQGIMPLQESVKTEVGKFVDSLSSLPRTTRTWALLHLASDAFTGTGRWEDWIITESQMLAATKELGPEALLQFLRDGTRQGLRVPKLDHAWNGSQFITTHARQLFTPVHAEALLELKFYTAAADVDPALVRRAADAGMKNLPETYQGRDRARVMAALAALGNAADRTRAAKWFYAEPAQPEYSTPQSTFIGELKRRKPREWRDIARCLVVDASFEQLRAEDVALLASFVDQFEAAESLSDSPPVGDFSKSDRQRLRARFQPESPGR